ncbi:hypothetical protein [Micromonospora rhizosphaerae]|uniref:hypothetical protein n=1 Tax=Micromonospora rhizosphaerae TaxID=568872 RepID=UPI001FDF6E45|nr:hypothetical protein [Micromonospora rhizosphaerae]
MSRDDDWVPEACTLPTAERPLRVAEFDELFATALRGQTRLSPTGPSRLAVWVGTGCIRPRWSPCCG